MLCCGLDSGGGFGVEGEVAPGVEAAFAFFAAGAFGWAFVVAACAGFAEGAFAVEFAFEPFEGFVYGFSFFEFYF